MPQAAIASLRGTFSMVSSTGGGLAPTQGTQELLAAAPGHDAVAKLETETLATLLAFRCDSTTGFAGFLIEIGQVDQILRELLSRSLGRW